ncbi:hypothetical protein Vadar_011237 [Vaccinium darrowii]|uniref:Uncharacterized protein n=1 Tax=Vaccinium darrowii TaxID=229202 RepID=A0ACB7WZK8_9ERIC|nr:hypothetical protein Vadar_011237 [Vaccinium darrowii]
MKASSLPNLNRETTSFTNFFTLVQDPNHHDDTTLNKRQKIEHSEDTEASETSPFKDILSPLLSFNERTENHFPIGGSFYQWDQMDRTQPRWALSPNGSDTNVSVGSNQFSGDDVGWREREFGFEPSLGSERLVMEPATASPWRYVITPYNEYPPLLGLLLKLQNGELEWSTRREILKVLGIMGALDPHAHKRNQLLLGSHGEVTHAASDTGQHNRSMDELPMEPSFATSEDYYSMVAINSLMQILRDPSLSSYHQKVVGSLMFIFKVLPDLFHTLRMCEDGLKEFITRKLGTLVSIVRQHIRKYLPELLLLISELWSSFMLPAANRPVHGYPVLHLVEQLCLALNDEFRTKLPDILPCCIQVLSDAERCNDYTYVLDILHTLEVFGGTLDEHMHLLLPALIRLFRVDASVEIVRASIKTFTRLIPHVQVTSHISALVHHLKLVLDGLVLTKFEHVNVGLETLDGTQVSSYFTYKECSHSEITDSVLYFDSQVLEKVGRLCLGGCRPRS